MIEQNLFWETITLIAFETFFLPLHPISCMHTIMLDGYRSVYLPMQKILYLNKIGKAYTLQFSILLILRFRYERYLFIPFLGYLKLVLQRTSSSTKKDPSSKKLFLALSGNLWWIFLENSGLGQGGHKTPSARGTQRVHGYRVTRRI